MANSQEEVKVQESIELQLCLEKETNVLVMKYSELAVQFGYIVMFGQAFPLSPFICILSNFIEMKSYINMLSFYSKRFQAQGAKGIGLWKGIFEVHKLVSVFTFIDDFIGGCSS